MKHPLSREALDKRIVELEGQVEAYKSGHEKFKTLFEALTRTITEQMTDVVALTDAAGVITYASPATRLLFHCPPEAMIGRPEKHR